MLLIVIHIIGCFISGLYVKARGFVRLWWMVLGSAALVCVLYLALDPSFLSGLSISSLSKGETLDMADHVPVFTGGPRGPVPGVRWVLERVSAPIAAGSAALEHLEQSAWAARLGLALYLLGAATIVITPRLGLYIVLFFTVVGDAVLQPWYPFVKGFSSRESLFFVHDALVVSPLELYLVLIAIGWAVQQRRHGQFAFRKGRLFWPTIVFLAFVVLGVVHGLATGGDLRIGLWEVRPVSYLIALVLLTSNLVETPSQVSDVFWIIVLAVFLKGVSGSLYYLFVLQGNLASIESIAEHAAAIQLNILFVSSLAVWIYGASRVKRFLLPLTIPCVLLAYLAMQRRAAVVTLAVALVLAIAVLYKENRRLFWMGAPALIVLGAGYVAMSWNSQSPLAVPAQAIKSVIAAQLASDKDQTSNDYRVLENRNINFTIHQHPVAGIGFGQKFSIIAPMADISQLFEWWEYITHNSIMWMWMKTGIGGFFSLLCLIGLAVGTGVQRLDELRSPDLRAVMLTATLYIVMHCIYACVDMSFDPSSTVLVGTMMGLVNCAEWIE